MEETINSAEFKSLIGGAFEVKGFVAHLIFVPDDFPSNIILIHPI